MTNHELASLYAECFPNDKTHWSAASIAQLRLSSSTHIFETEHGALFLQMTAEEAEILSVFVAPFQMQKGEATHLMGVAIAHAQSHGVRSIFLEVAADNQAGLQLYQKLGFERLGKRKAYYERKLGPRVDALTLRLDL